jgi:hypothetical protein
VLLAQVEEWDPPVPMSAVLSQIEPSENAKAEFETGVVRITASEYETALAVAAERATSRRQRAKLPADGYAIARSRNPGVAITLTALSRQYARAGDSLAHRSVA